MPDNAVQFKLDCAQLDESQLQALSRDFARSLVEAGVGNASLRQQETAPGLKGDVVTIGVIMLTLIQTGGVAVKLLDVLKAYIERKQTLRLEVTRADGRKIVIDSSWFGRTRPEPVQTLLADFCKD